MLAETGLVCSINVRNEEKRYEIDGRFGKNYQKKNQHAKKVESELSYMMKSESKIM